MRQMIAGKQTAIKVKRKYNNKLFYMSIPFLLIIFAFAYVPLFGWIFAFYKYIPGIPVFQCKFVGLDNFKFLLSDHDIIRVLRNTLVMSFLGLACTPLPVILAIMLNEVRSSRYKKLIQTTTTLPNFISWIIVYAIGFSLFSSEGVVNLVLSALHITSKPVNVLGNSKITWYFMEALNEWKSLGWNSIIYIAAIAGIDAELYESATIDGAGRMKSIWYITVPGIAPTFIVLLLLKVSTLLNNGLDQYLMFYNSMVASKIEVLDYYVYRMGIVSADYSYGTAVGVFKSVISVLLLFTANGIAKRIRGDSIV